MAHSLRIFFLAVLAVLAGCVAVVPITEYTPTTTDGTLHTSNFLGAKSVRYVFDGVPVFVTLDRGRTEPLELRIGLTLAEGQVARVPAPEIRISSLDQRSVEVRLLPDWERHALRFVKPRNKRLERVIVEIAPAAGPLVGGVVDDGSDVVRRPATKTFSTSIPIRSLAASGYQIALPAIEINGRLNSISPIEYRKQHRVEWMVPANC